MSSVKVKPDVISHGERMHHISVAMHHGMKASAVIRADLPFVQTVSGIDDEIAGQCNFCSAYSQAVRLQACRDGVRHTLKTYLCFVHHVLYTLYTFSKHPFLVLETG